MAASPGRAYTCFDFTSTNTAPTTPLWIIRSILGPGLGSWLSTSQTSDGWTTWRSNGDREGCHASLSDLLISNCFYLPPGVFPWNRVARPNEPFHVTVLQFDVRAAIDAECGSGATTFLLAKYLPNDVALGIVPFPAKQTNGQRMQQKV